MLSSQVLYSPAVYDINTALGQKLRANFFTAFEKLQSGTLLPMLTPDEQEMLYLRLNSGVDKDAIHVGVRGDCRCFLNHVIYKPSWYPIIGN